MGPLLMDRLEHSTMYSQESGGRRRVVVHAARDHSGPSDSKSVDSCKMGLLKSRSATRLIVACLPGEGTANHSTEQFRTPDLPPTIYQLSSQSGLLSLVWDVA